jgi:hypothetical protein
VPMRPAGKASKRSDWPASNDPFVRRRTRSAVRVAKAGRKDSATGFSMDSSVDSAHKLGACSLPNAIPIKE